MLKKAGEKRIYMRGPKACGTHKMNNKKGYIIFILAYETFKTELKNHGRYNAACELILLDNCWLIEQTLDYEVGNSTKPSVHNAVQSTKAPLGLNVTNDINSAG